MKSTKLLVSVIFKLTIVSIFVFRPLFAQNIEHNWNLPITVSSKDTGDGETYVLGEIVIPMSPEKVWEVLTDYNNLSSFIPSMKSSQVLEDFGEIKIITQTGKSQFLVFSKTVTVKLQIEEQLYTGIIFRLLEGPFHIYSGKWSLQNYKITCSTRLTYQSIVKPNFFSPKFLTNRVLKNEFRESLEGVRLEVRRRRK